MKNINIVTDASSGIGYALCCHLAQSNKAVIAIARREDRLKALKNEHPKLISTIVADLATQAGRDKVVKVVSVAGQVLGLVNNAATNEPISRLEKLSLERWQQQVAINLDAPIFLTQALLPFLNSGAKVLNLTSGAANFVIDGVAGYAMTKAALSVFTKYLSAELSSRNILVTAAHPGIVKTEMVDVLAQHNDASLGASKAHKEFEEEGKFLDVNLSAKFLCWLLLDADSELYTGDCIGIYNKEYQPLWHNEEIASPYPSGVESP